jgi:hypothetical protein
MQMPGRSKTLNKVLTALKWTLGGLGLITAFIPGLQPVSALLGITSGAMSVADGVSNMIQQKNEGKLTTANKIDNITNIVSGSLGMAAPVAGLIGSQASMIGSNFVSKAANLVEKGISTAEKVSDGINAIATVPNSISQVVRNKDYYDNNMNFIK